MTAWLVILRSRVRSQTQYRTSFTLNCLAAALSQATELVAIAALFSQVKELAGFSAIEVLTIYALSSTAFGLAELGVGSLNLLPTYIRTGTFDTLLGRPLNVLGQLLTSEVQLHRMGRAVVGVFVLGSVVASADIALSPDKVLLLILAPTAGALIIGSIWLISSSLSFWLIRGEEVTVSVTYGTNLLTAYPLTVFSDPLRVALAFVVPGAFVAYYPSLALMDRPDPLGGPEFLAWSSPIVALVFMVFSGGVWRLAMKNYQGTGS